MTHARGARRHSLHCQSRYPDKARRSIGLDYIVKNKFIKLTTPRIILNANNVNCSGEAVCVL